VKNSWKSEAESDSESLNFAIEDSLLESMSIKSRHDKFFSEDKNLKSIS